MNNSSNFLQELREKSNIVEVAARYIDLERKGNRHWAKCPIHNEKTASFTLDEDRGTYHCFGCGASGDVFSFIQEVEHCDFKDAIKMLADRAGMQVPTYSNDRNQQKKDEERRKKERLYMLMKEAAVCYWNNLRSPNGREAMEYISNRGINSVTLNVFGIGCSVGYNLLIDQLREKGFTNEELIDSGIAGEKNGRFYDFEADRLVVPIFNNSGQVIAFGGRCLVKTDFMKYKNTGETLIFKKRFELFGVHTLKKAKLTENFNKVIVVEGYMDVIALHQAGIKNVCASMGTALTIEQAKQLKYFNTNIYLCYDGDRAGQDATYKGIDVLRDVGLNVKVVTLLEGMDPDDIIKNYGVGKFKELVDSAVSPTEYKIKSTAKKHDLTVPEGQGQFAVASLDILSELATMVEREAYLPMIAELSRLSKDSLKKQLNKQADSNTGYRETKEISNTIPRNNNNFGVSLVVNKYFKAARYMLYEIFSSGALKYIKDNLTPYLDDKEHLQIYDFARELNSAGVILNIDLLLDLEGNSEAVKITNGKYDKIPAGLTDAMLADCLKSLKISYYEVKLDDLNKQYEEEPNVDEKNNILILIKECMSKIIEIKNGGSYGR